jgi:hypothetical protein
MKKRISYCNKLASLKILFLFLSIDHYWKKKEGGKLEKGMKKGDLTSEMKSVRRP